jgi:hypothetical protein
VQEDLLVAVGPHVHRVIAGRKRARAGAGELVAGFAQRALAARDFAGQNAALKPDADRHRSARCLGDDVGVHRRARELERGDHVFARGGIHGRARTRVVERGGRRVELVDAALRDEERVEARVVGRFLARRLVDLAVAVVVFTVAAHLDVPRVDRGVVVVAVASRFAMPVGKIVAVGVAQVVLARARRFDAGVDRAGLVVVAVEDRALPAAEVRIASLDAVAVGAVLAARIVEDELTAAQVVVARIQRAIHAVVTLPIVEAWLAEDRPVGRTRVARATLDAGIARLAPILDERARAAAARAACREQNQKPKR